MGFAPIIDSGTRTGAAPTAAGELLGFERLVLDLSAGFINLPAWRIDEAMENGLHRIVDTLGIDRSSLTSLWRSTGRIQITHSYAVPGVDPAPPPMSTLDSWAWPWAWKQLRANRPVVFARLDDLPPEASLDRTNWGRIGLKSHVSMPVVTADEVYGCVSFGCVRCERTWPEQLLQRMRLMAEIFANALARKRALEDIERALGFERLLVDISAALLRERPSHPGAAINSALQIIGKFLEAERIVLWRLSGEGDRYEPTQLWVAEGVPGPPTLMDETMMPTVFRRLVAGEVVALSSIDELPPEAEADRWRFRQIGTRSYLAVPLAVDGFPVGAFSLSSVHAERTWPEAIIPRVRLIGEVFAGLLTRQHYATKVKEAESETAQYRERLAHLVRVHTVGEMSAAIAHEVNQPLVAIETYALAARRRLAMATTADNDKALELLKKIGGQAARAGEVMKRLRSIVRKHESEATRFDLGALVTDTANLVEMESRLKDVQMEIVVAPGLPAVVADEVQIQQVVLNLARNAIEAMDQAGIRDKILRMEVHDAGKNELMVRIIDRGGGLGPADREHLFEPFYSTKEKGLGIGLAICRSIVEAHGGKLSYARDSEGRTVFQFTLPLADETTEL